MRRRDFIAALGGGTLVSFAAPAQQPGMPIIGVLNSRSPADTTHLMRGFRAGLAETGYTEGRNLAIEYRWALGQYDRLPALAAELVDRKVVVLVATGGENVGIAAKAATSTIPIVFVVSGDPASLGLAASFAHPAGNSTGVSTFTSDIGAKRLGLLRDLVPQATKVAFLSNPEYPTAETQLADVQEGARKLGVQIDVYRASTDLEVELAFNAITQQRPAGLIVAADPFFDTRRAQLVTLAAGQALPAIYQLREYTVAGGLISYGIDLPDIYRQMGNYTGRILKGARPADLPVVRPTRFELVINLQTAKALGLTVPQSILGGADEVIE